VVKSHLRNGPRQEQRNQRKRVMQLAPTRKGHSRAQGHSKHKGKAGTRAQQAQGHSKHKGKAGTRAQHMRKGTASGNLWLAAQAAVPLTVSMDNSTRTVLEQYHSQSLGATVLEQYHSQSLGATILEQYHSQSLGATVLRTVPLTVSRATVLEQYGNHIPYRLQGQDDCKE